jgi:hypothetical protein
MRTLRLILALLLLATPLLNAQGTVNHVTEGQPAAAQDAAQSQKEQTPPDEAFRITITFKTAEGGKTTTQRTYAMVATSRSGSGIRDDSRVSVKTNPNTWQTMDIKTDVDIGQFHRTKTGDLYLDLRIFTENFVENPNAQEQNTMPIVRSHQYNVTPTLPIGKLVTVCSVVDAANDSKVDVQVLVQPLDAK